MTAAPVVDTLPLPVVTGSCSRVNVADATAPGALALTWIEVSDDAEAEKVEERGAEILEELLRAPGFLGFVGTTMGRRGHTISAWESVAAAESGMAHSRAHRRARRAFRSGSLGDGGFTSLWTPHRLNAQYIRCPQCSTLTAVPPPWTAIPCRCGATVAPAPFL